MTGSLVLIAVTASTLLVGACSSATTTLGSSSASTSLGSPSGKSSDAPARCLLTRSDSAFLKGGAAYRECGVDKPAKQLPGEVRPNWAPSSPPSAVNPMKCYSAEIDFVVNAAGKPESETARLVSASDPGYGRAWMEALSNLRFEAARKGGAPVRQIVRFSPKATLTLQGVNVPRQGQPDC